MKSKCQACEKDLQLVDNKHKSVSLCPDCINVVLNEFCPVCRSGLKVEYDGPEGKYKCSSPSCPFSVPLEIYGSMARNKRQQEKTPEIKLHEAIVQIEKKFPKKEKKASKKNEHLNADEYESQSTLSEAVLKQFGVRISCASGTGRLSRKGWFYQERSDVLCPQCNSDAFEIFRKRYLTRSGTYFYIVLVCRRCVEAKTLKDLPVEFKRYFKKYSLKKGNIATGSKTEKRKPNELIYTQKHGITGSGEIDTPETKKGEIKERVESALSKLKKAGSYYYFDNYYPSKFVEQHNSSVLSKSILTFKSNKALLRFLCEKLNQVGLPDGVAICCVPSSDSQKGASNLRILCLEFCRENDFEDLSSCLKRHKTVGKASFGLSKRDKSKTLNSVSLVFKETLADKVVVLIDDIVTTGNTLQACKDILMKSDVHHVFCLSFGSTTRPD